MIRAEEGSLEAALLSRERLYRESIDRLRALAPASTENEVYEITIVLREAIELVACARRMARGLPVAVIHAAFGAPGDFGYENPIGAALDRLYRGPATPESR